MSKTNDILKIMGRSTAWTLLAVLTLGLYGMAMAIHRDTIINGSIVTVVALSMAVLTGIAVANLLASRAPADSGLWMKIAGVMIFAGGLYLFSFYALNYHCADEESIQSEEVVVIRKYYEVHHHSERSGRRSYSTGRPYNVYYMEVSFPDGQTKKMRISMKRYNKLHKGDVLHMELEKGLFGFPVIRDNPY